MRHFFIFLVILFVSTVSTAQNCKDYPVASRNSDLSEITKQYQQIIEQQMGDNDTVLPSDFFEIAKCYVKNIQKTKEIKQYPISKDLINKRPDIVFLVIWSPSFKTEEKQYWFANIIPKMNSVQKDQLFDILRREFARIYQIEREYEKRRVEIAEGRESNENESNQGDSTSKNTAVTAQIPPASMAQDNVDFDSLYVLVGQAEASGNTQKAIEIREHIAEKYKELYGENHPKYANELMNIGLTYQAIQDYQNAVSYCEKSASIYHLLNDTLESMRAMYFLGSIYEDSKDLPKAISYYNQYVQLYKNIHKDFDVHLFETEVLLGNLYVDFGDKYKGLVHLENACEIREQLHGYQHKAYIKDVESLINAYDKLGETEYYENRNFIVAIDCMKHSADLCKKIYGDKSIPYAVRLSDIGHIYSSIGNSRKAIEYYEQSLNLAKRNRYDKVNYATILNNNGVEYGHIGEYQKAINCLNSSLKTARKIHNPSRNEHVVLALCNLAFVYASMGDYDKAQCYVEKCLGLVEQTVGKQSAQYSYFQGSLGEIYFLKGDYQTAIPMLLKTMGAVKSIVGEDNIEYASSVLELGRVYYCDKQYRMATNYISYAENICMQDVTRTFSIMTEEDRKLYWEQILPVLSPAYASNYRYSTDSTLSTLYNMTLFSKGLLLSSSIEFGKVIAESGDKQAVETYEELLSLRKMITSQKQVPVTERTYDMEKAELRAEQLERQLVSLSKEFGDFTQYLKLGWRDVQASLSDRDVAVEFVDFPLDIVNSSDSVYVALVIRKGWKAPKMIPLPKEKQIRMFSDKIQTGDRNSINDFYNNPEIYNAVWGPLESENIIQEGDTIYFSASGLLHKLGVEYLPRFLDKNFTIRRLSSTKQLCIDSPGLSYNGAVLYGGLKYDTDDQTKIAESNKAYSNGYNAYGMDSKLMADMTRGSVSYHPWSELKGTKMELDSICKLYESHGLQYEVYSGSSGVEETFKMLSGRNIPLIFISTHGFFIPESQVKRNVFMQALAGNGGDNNSVALDLTMQRSGLVMSGGNAAWMGDPIPEGVEDGILTAQEVSELNLRGASLVVLSACETGLGSVSGEGVFGLQRGFKKAGAQTLIMSLWKVSDDATYLMMSTFFRHLLDGESKYDAFRAAQETVGKKYGSNPYYWAAFIMLD